MRRSLLGRTELSISVLGLGTWAFGGNDWDFGWGAQDDADSVATLRRALEHGINWVDTAPVYGLGHAETILGRALAEIPVSERPLVFTKCGVRWTERRKVFHSLEAGSIREEVESSLVRLRTDVIDLCQIHWPDYPPDGPAERIEEGWETLTRLRAEGKVRHIGVSNFDVSQLERIGRIAAAETLQPPYSLLDRDAERELLPYCAGRGIGVITYSPLQSGLLTGKVTPEYVRALPADDWRRSKSLDFREPRLSAAQREVEALRALAEREGVSVPQLAIAWTLRHPQVAGCVVGARSPRQLEENVVAAAIRPTFSS